MSLCGITHEAPGPHHTPATRAQMAAKQTNYFNWCPAQTLQGHFGILCISHGIIEENMCHGGMKTSGRFSLSSTGPGAVLVVFWGKQSIWGAVPTAHWYKKFSFQSALLEFVVISSEKCRLSVFDVTIMTSMCCLCFSHQQALFLVVLCLRL